MTAFKDLHPDTLPHPAIIAPEKSATILQFPDRIGQIALQEPQQIVPEFIEALPVSLYAGPSQFSRVYGFNVPEAPKYANPVLEVLHDPSKKGRIILRRHRTGQDATRIQ